MTEKELAWIFEALPVLQLLQVVLPCGTSPNRARRAASGTTARERAALATEQGFDRWAQRILHNRRKLETGETDYHFDRSAELGVE